MTNLTELWKKGELPYAEYYIKLGGGEYTNDVWDIDGWQYFNKKGDEVVEVLAPVPSYEECQKLLSDQLAKIEGEEINAELEAENAKLKTKNKELCKKIDELYENIDIFATENAKLKKQLAIAVECMREYLRGGCYPLMEKKLKEIEEFENKNKIFTYMGEPVDALTYIEKKIEYERKELEK